MGVWIKTILWIIYIIRNHTKTSHKKGLQGIIFLQSFFMIHACEFSAYAQGSFITVIFQFL